MNNGISLVACLLTGGGVVWLLLSVKRERERARQSEETALLAERLRGTEQRLEELRLEQQRAAVLTGELRSELAAERDRRSAAEEKNSRIPQLEGLMREREEALRGVQEDNAQLQAKLAALVSRYQEERKSAEEKLAVIDSAQAKLADAFKALSAEALRSNNQSFLELAKSTLEKFQEGARGDLELRQRAVDELVKPIRESLDKVDGKIQDLEKIRLSAYASLTEQVKSLATSQAQLQGKRRTW